MGRGWGGGGFGYTHFAAQITLNPSNWVFIKGLHVVFFFLLIGLRVTKTKPVDVFIFFFL